MNWSPPKSDLLLYPVVRYDLQSSVGKLLYCVIKGAFFWDYSINFYSGIRITEHSEYQFPKEQTLCYSENRIADVTKIKAMRPRKSGYAIFCQKTGENCHNKHDHWLFCLFRTNRYSIYSLNSAIRSRIDGILFRSFWNQNRSQKNTITANSVYSHSRIINGTGASTPISISIKAPLHSPTPTTHTTAPKWYPLALNCSHNRDKPLQDIGS